MAGTTGCHKAVKERFKEHKGYITQHANLLRKGKAKATGYHFNLPGHNESDMRITLLEKVHSKDPFMREEREKFYITKFHSGLLMLVWLQSSPTSPVVTIAVDDGILVGTPKLPLITYRVR